MKQIAIIWICLSCTGCFVGEELAPDQDTWLYALPSSKGLNENNLYELDEQLKLGDYGVINSLIIIKDDHLVYENYYTGNSRADLEPVGAASLAVMILILDDFIANGLINSLDDPIMNYLPDYQSFFDDDTLKRDITIRHLLTHRSGIIWNEAFATSDFENDLLAMKQSADFVSYVLGQRQDATPGQRVTINSASGILLSRIYQNLLTDITLEQHIAKTLFEPLDIDNYRWNYDLAGNLDGATGLNISTFDFTKLGYLLLLEGRWTSQERIIDRDWILDLTTTWTPFTLQYSFGYGWWVFSEDYLSQAFPNLNQMYFLTGESGQVVYVIPERNMIVSMVGNNLFSDRVYNQSLRVLQKTVQSLGSSQLN